MRQLLFVCIPCMRALFWSSYEGPLAFFNEGAEAMGTPSLEMEVGGLERVGARDGGDWNGIVPLVSQ